MRESETSKQNYQLRSGLILAIVGTALFALKSIFIKLAYQQGVDTTTLLTLRMVIALPFYIGMLIWLLQGSRQKSLPTRKEMLAIAALGFIGYYLSSWLDMEALNYISAQLERLTLYTYPIMTTFLGWLILKETINRKIILALFLTYTGVVVLYAQEASVTGAQATIGVLLVAVAAFNFSLYVVLSKGLITRIGSRLFTSLAMLASTIFVLIHFSITNQMSDLVINRYAWFYAGLLAFFSTVLPSFLVSEAIARIGAGKTSIVGSAGPVFTIALAVIWLDEAFGWTHLAGMLLVMLGVMVLSKR